MPRPARRRWASGWKKRSKRRLSGRLAMDSNKPSLRYIAGELYISPAYLSYMVNGKRPWRKDLYQRYMGVVNTFVNSEVQSVNKQPETASHSTAHLGVNLLGAGRGTRTHTAVRPADFKSAASTIPPSRQLNLWRCRGAIKGTGALLRPISA